MHSSYLLEKYFLNFWALYLPPCVSLKRSKVFFVISSSLEVAWNEREYKNLWDLFVFILLYFIPPSRVSTSYIKDSSNTRDTVCGWQRCWRMCHGKNHIDLFVCSSLEMEQPRTSLARPEPLEFTVTVYITCIYMLLGTASKSGQRGGSGKRIYCDWMERRWAEWLSWNEISSENSL